MKLRIPDLALVSFVIVTCTLYVVGQTNPEWFLVPSYALTWIGAIVAPLSTLYLFKSWRTLERKRQITIFLLSLGFFLWLAAEILRGLYVFVFGIESPYPSVADGIWFLGYFLIGVTFYSIMKWTKYFQKPRLRILHIIVSLGLGLLVLETLFIPMVTNIDEVSLAAIVDLTYPILDIVLFSLVFASFIALLGTNLWESWTPISFGFLLYIIADIWHAVLDWNGAYFDGHLLEIFWIVGDVSLAYGCFQIASRSFDLHTFLKLKAPPSMHILSEERPFSKTIGSNVKGKAVLLEFDPTCHYEKVVEWFISEFSPALVFTYRGSTIHNLSKQKGQKIVILSETARVPTTTSESEIALPARNLSLMAEAIDNALKMSKRHATRLSLVFENLSDLILSIGFERTYRFLFLVLEMLYSENATSLFLLNSRCLSKEQLSAIRNIFSNQIMFENEQMHTIKLA